MRFVRHIAAAAAVLGMLSGAPAAHAERAPAGAVAAQEATLRIMPLGDSITWGVGTPGNDSYRTELYDRLTAAGLDVDFVGSQRSGTGADRDNEGHPGWTIDQIAERVDDWLDEYQPDVVLLHLGTNDMHVGTAYPEFRLAELLDRIHKRLPQAQVFVAKLIGLGATAHTGGQLARTAEYNRNVARLVAQRGDAFHLVDPSAVHGVDMYDRLHPNSFGYRRMAWSWYRALEPVLNDSGTAWPGWDNPDRQATSYRCLGRTTTLPSYAQGCRSWTNRRQFATGKRVWQLPVRRSIAFQAGSEVKVRTTVQWISAP